MDEDLRKRRELRTALLKKVYDLTQGSTASGVNGAEAAVQLGIKNDQQEQLRDAALYLHDEALVKVTRVQGGFPAFIQLTHKGLKEIEQAIAAPNTPTEHLAPINFLYINNAIGSNIQQATTGSTQTINVDTDSVGRIKEFLAAISQSAPTISLKEDDKRELEAEVKTIQAQVESPKPKAPIIRDGLVSIRSILEKAAGSVIALELAKQIEPLLRMLGF
jgi:hypothetical protein